MDTEVRAVAGDKCAGLLKELRVALRVRRPAGKTCLAVKCELVVLAIVDMVGQRDILMIAVGGDDGFAVDIDEPYWMREDITRFPER